MSSDSIDCRLITPEAELVNAKIRYAQLPAWDGQMGIMPNHAPFVGKLGLGELRLDFSGGGAGAASKGEGGSRRFLVEDGFVQINNNQMRILATLAIPAERLTESEAQTELQQVSNRTVPADAPDRAKQSERLTKERRRAELKLRMARANRGI